MKNFRLFFLAIMTVGLVSGCTSLGKAPEKVLPLHDEVLHYNLPFDLTFLRTMEALENVEGWELEETEKEKGIIRARNMDFDRFADFLDSRATILVERVSRQETSVRLAPESQRITQGDELLKSISKFVTTEL